MRYLDRKEWETACKRWYISGNFAIDKQGKTRGYWNKNSGEGKVYHD